MGNRLRSWTGLIAFSALAILMAALRPSDLPESPVVDVVVADAIPAPSVAPSAYVVASL